MILEEDGHVHWASSVHFVPHRENTINLSSAAGDILRQGAPICKSLRRHAAHSIMSPLSGVITEVNQKVLGRSNSALQDRMVTVGWFG